MLQPFPPEWQERRTRPQQRRLPSPPPCTAIFGGFLRDQEIDLEEVLTREIRALLPAPAGEPEDAVAGP